MHDRGHSNTHPAVLEARELILLEEQHRRQIAAARDYDLERAVMLALDLKACESLLRGEAVPLSRLDPVQLRKYGIRAAA